MRKVSKDLDAKVERMMSTQKSPKNGGVVRDLEGKRERISPHSSLLDSKVNMMMTMQSSNTSITVGRDRSGTAAELDAKPSRRGRSQSNTIASKTFAGPDLDAFLDDKLERLSSGNSSQRSVSSKVPS